MTSKSSTKRKTTTRATVKRTSTRSQTSRSLSYDAQIARMKVWTSKLGLDESLVNKMLEKYGPYAHQIMQTAMLTPHKLTSALGQSPKSSSKTVQALAKANLTDEEIAKLTGKNVLKIQSEMAQFRIAHPETRAGTPIEQVRDQKITQEPIVQTPTENTQQNEVPEALRPSSDKSTQAPWIKWTAAKKEALNKEYEKLYGKSDNVSITDLMKKAGVTQADIQAVYQSHPELIHNIGGGKTCQSLAASAQNVKVTQTSHSCHSGVQKIFNQCRNDSISCPDARRAAKDVHKPYQGNSNGGCCLATALEASGNFIVLETKNTAYGKTQDCKENKELNTFFNQVQPGVSQCINCIEDATMRQQKGNTPGGKWGHDCVKRNDGKWGSDFVQTNINYARYGKEIWTCFPKDAEIPEEYAKLIIEQAYKRQGKQLEIPVDTKDSMFSNPTFADTHSYMNNMQLQRKSR